jgi:hypothetical protein
MIHLSDACQLPLSAGDCPLCAIILDAVLQCNTFTPLLTDGGSAPVQWNMRDLKNHLVNKPIYLRPKHDPIRRAFPLKSVADAWHLRGFKAFVPVDQGVLTAQVRLFADAGTASPKSDITLIAALRCHR